MGRDPLRLLLNHCCQAGLADAELLERFVARRDEAAFELLVWRHGPMVLGVCRRLLRHEQDAEDAFQATFLVLARKAASIGRQEAVAAWLHQVARRVALTARQRAAVRCTRERPWRDVAAPIGDDLEWRDLRPVLDDEVRRLPAKYRTAFVLCHLEGLTNEEAARELGCPTGTVLSRLSRARERLRRNLTRRGVALSAAALAACPSQAALAAGLVATTLAAALTGNPTAPAVITLTEGALRAMYLTKLRVALVVVLAVGFAGAGAAALGRRVEGPVPAQAAADGKPEVNEDAIKRAARLAQSQQHLKWVGIALHNYHDTYGHFPAPAVYSRDGKPLLSWRVLILPFIEQDNLYRRFKLDEPWDGPNNQALLNEMPSTFEAVGPLHREPGYTYVQAISGKGAAFEPRRPLRLADVTDGTSNTIGVVEAATPVPWTKPEDVTFDVTKPRPRLGGLFEGDFNALFLDGSVRFLSGRTDEQTLRFLFTRGGGEVVEQKKLIAPASGPGGGAVTAARVRAENAGLKLALQTSAREVEKLRGELETLKTQVAFGAPGLDRQTLQMLRENQEMLTKLAQVLNELDQLKAEKKNLEKEMERIKGRP